MYRVIFIFDIGDLYHLLEEAVERLRERKVVPYAPYEMTHCWIRHQLQERLQLLVREHAADGIVRSFDRSFQLDTEPLADRLYRQTAPAILHHHHPCVESWCAVSISRSTLYLTFSVGPIDYGAHLA
jgi:hypothetical protein